MKVTRSNTVKGVLKNLRIHEGNLISEETGEIVPLVDYLEKAFGGATFNATFNTKDDSEEEI